MASEWFCDYHGRIMNILAASYLGSVGFGLVFQLVVLVIAVIAASRYRLTGLWFLAAAIFLTVFQDVMGLMSTSGHENAITDSAWLQYIPWATMILVLCGWSVLAFSHKQGAKP